jgi:hypothetical protein
VVLHPNLAELALQPATSEIEHPRADIKIEMQHVLQHFIGHPYRSWPRRSR